MKSKLETKVTITRVPVKGGELFRAEIGDTHTKYFKSQVEALEYAAACLNADIYPPYVPSMPPVPKLRPTIW